MSGPVATPACQACIAVAPNPVRFAGGITRPVQNVDACPWPRSIAACLLSTPPLICIIALLAGCGTTALKPEPKLVSSVTSLPPVNVPVPVRCVKEIPPVPKVTIDPNSTVLQRYYAMRELIAAQDEYAIRANAALTACAAEPSK